MSLGLPIVDRDVHHLRGLQYAFLPYAVFDADFGERRSNGRSSLLSVCVNPHADFYPYRASLAKAGHQLGLGNCRKTDERMVAAPIEQCVVIAGTSELPFEPAAAAAPPADRTAARGQRRERQKATRMIAAAAEAGGIQGHLLIPLQR